MSTKTDNAELGKKVALRIEMLERWHSDTAIDVLDCCQGRGVMWTIIRSRLPVDSYWGVDLKPALGRLKIDSTRLLRAGPRRENVIDIDTYGAPWAHWQAIMESGIEHPTTVFMTNGSGMGALSQTSKFMAGWLGIERWRPRVPTLVRAAEQRCGIQAALYAAEGYGIRIVECIEDQARNARYFGVRLERA